MRKNNYRRNIGSVSHATMREEDLIPAFIWELRQMKPLRREDRRLLRAIEARMEKPGYYDSEDSSFDLNECLFDALDTYALPYFYFGAHPGDGSDYGFWLSEHLEDDFDGLKVNDLSEVPANYSGEVLLVNDHGNMSLYIKSRNGRVREIWSVV
jgi:hypothetical protein